MLEIDLRQTGMGTWSPYIRYPSGSGYGHMRAFQRRTDALLWAIESLRDTHPTYFRHYKEYKINVIWADYLLDQNIDGIWKLYDLGRLDSNYELGSKC